MPGDDDEVEEAFVGQDHGEVLFVLEQGEGHEAVGQEQEDCNVAQDLGSDGAGGTVGPAGQGRTLGEEAQGLRGRDKNIQKSLDGLDVHV